MARGHQFPTSSTDACRWEAGQYAFLANATGGEGEVEQASLAHIQSSIKNLGAHKRLGVLYCMQCQSQICYTCTAVPHCIQASTLETSMTGRMGSPLPLALWLPMLPSACTAQHGIHRYDISMSSLAWHPRLYHWLAISSVLRSLAHTGSYMAQHIS